MEAVISYTFQFLHGVMCDGQLKLGQSSALKLLTVYNCLNAARSNCTPHDQLLLLLYFRL